MASSYMDYEHYQLVVEVLKAGNTFPKAMLSTFERRFIGETTHRFVLYGRKMSVRGQQWRVFNELADKLGLNTPQVEVPDEPEVEPDIDCTPVEDIDAVEEEYSKTLFHEREG